MRFILTDEIEISLPTIEQALRRIDTSYSISASGQLLHSDNVYAQLEISRQGDEGFDEELTELRELAADAGGKRKREVLAVLDGAVAMLALEVLWQERSVDATLDRIDPLWAWLFTNYRGLLQADGEGYYDASDRILKVD